MPVEKLIFASQGGDPRFDDRAAVPLFLDEGALSAMRVLAFRLQRQYQGLVTILSSPVWPVAQSASVLAEVLVGFPERYHTATRLWPPENPDTKATGAAVQFIMKYVRQLDGGALVVVTQGVFTSTLPRQCFVELGGSPQEVFFSLLPYAKAHVINVAEKSWKTL